MATKEKEPKTGLETVERFRILEWVINLKKKHGLMNIIVSGFLMVFMSVMVTLALNPSIVFEKYSEYEEIRHAQSFEYRMKSSRAIQLILKDVLEETGAKRCFIVEMHNGKYNAAGLSFNYGSLTYEERDDTTTSIMEDYADFSLEKYPLILKLYEDGSWVGSTSELMSIDRKLALRLESNDAYSIAVATIYGVKSDIGFIGVTFGDDISHHDKVTLSLKMAKFAAQVSPFLDGEKAKE